MRLPNRLDWSLAVTLAVMAIGGCATSPGSIGGDREALQLQIQTLEARLRTLEARPEQVSVAVMNARAAVAFVWGTYTFVDPGGRPLRHVLNDEGEPIADPHGVPLVDLAGTGPTAVTDYSGTAFLVDTQGHLLTNRHIAEPWWGDESSAPLLTAGLRPVFLRLRAFFQERPDGVPLEVVRVDAEQDVALARTVGWIPTAAPLPLHPEPERLREGQPVVLVSYPTGLDAVLSRLDAREQAALERATGPDRYALAEVLARTHRLAPTMMGGFLWEVLPYTLVYDARTTGGGSGGPLLDRQGRVIGINAAYLPEFEGANYGVPIRLGGALLTGGGLTSDGPTRETPEALATSAARGEAPLASDGLDQPVKQNRR